MARPPYLHVDVRSSIPGRPPAARDIVDAIAGDRARGALPSGARVPPVRALEHQLGISKNTVQAAYDELVARGVLESRSRDGVFVRAPESTPAVERVAAAPAVRLAEIRAHVFQSPRDGRIALSNVFVDPALLPRERLAECIRSVMHAPGLPTSYDPQGLPILRELIAERLRARGMPAEAEQVVVTTGSQQALDIVARSLAAGAIAVEDPVYQHARSLFQSLGKALAPLPLDPFGPLDRARWRQVLEQTRPGLLYAITSFHNPTGRSYSTAELAEILALARELDFGILEDDWGSDMLSCGEYRPTLRALGGPSVLYVNSFTKKLLPSLRIGFVVADDQNVQTLVSAKRLSTLGNATLMEAALAEFLDRGYYDTHLVALQAALDVRYHACLEALRDLMPAGVRWTTPGGGPTLWLELPRAIALGALRERLLARGITIEPMAGAFHSAPHLHGFPIGYASMPPETMRRSLETLASELSPLTP